MTESEAQYEYVRRGRDEAVTRMHMYQSMLIEFSRVRDTELRQLCDLCWQVSKKKGICSAHQPSSGVIEAMRKRRQADLGNEIMLPTLESEAVTVTWFEAQKIVTDALLDMEARRIALAERETADTWDDELDRLDELDARREREAANAPGDCVTEQATESATILVVATRMPDGTAVMRYYNAPSANVLQIIEACAGPSFAEQLLGPEDVDRIKMMPQGTIIVHDKDE